MPLVSILVPCYNAAQWVGQAIESALNQSWPEKEVIVIDDGSSDGSLDIIKRFGDSIQWYTQVNAGGGRTRNRLLELARGEWIQYLDADDYLLVGKIASQLEFLTRCPNADVVFSPVILEHWTEQGGRSEVYEIPVPHDVWILLTRWYLPQTGAALWRRSAIDQVGGWKPDQPCCQEHDLYLRLLMAGKRFVYCPDAGAVYRQWGDHTVCKRDRREVRKRRLAIEDAAETFLEGRGDLTTERRRAINQARFEVARLAWQQDPGEARRIVNHIKASQKDFIPGLPAAPSHYQLLYRFIGFGATETLADWHRRLRKGAAAV
jgi:glycosyltransferase involved in cell wall biosynthesis